MKLSRREFVAGMGILAASSSTSVLAAAQSPELAKSPFKISVITDEVSQDFGHACEVASQRISMGWVEIRSLWN